MKGLHRGKEELVLRMMKRKFGEVKPQLAERLDWLAIEQLDDIGEALLDFDSPADVETWLSAH